jgi:hypothetical protein
MDVRRELEMYLGSKKEILEQAAKAFEDKKKAYGK